MRSPCQMSRFLIRARAGAVNGTGRMGMGYVLRPIVARGSISGVSLTTSEVTGSVNSGIYLAGESDIITISRSKIHTNDSHGIELSETSATSLQLDVSTSLIYSNGGYGIAYNSTTAAGFNILHNTFYDNTTINFSVSNQVGTANIRNNLFHSSSAMTHIYVAGTLSGVTFDNNCYQDQGNMFGYNGSTYSSVSAFYGATGFEASGTGSGTIGLSNPGSADFTIPVGSSCDGLGDVNVGVLTDYVENSFTYPPASGAYEAQ